MAPPTVPELVAFQSVLSNLDELPYCTGTVALDASTSNLFYQSGDPSTAEIIDFAKATDQQLDSLARACDPATFGVAQKDVLDESYRKAGKMDAIRFATHFSPSELGILDIVTDLLLRGRVPEKSIHIELYKLNIYGPGGFFKSHVDTPRSDTMFGSLVVVLPTVHEGGSLIIRHNKKEWTFDSSKAVNTKPIPHAAFVAFFSDVEHEVTTVTSGYRVTLTYNLYLKKKKPANQATTLTTGFDQTDKDLKNALARLLKNPAFLPEGGVLGFGFAHKYPFSQATTNLSDLSDRLKGTDAALKRACDFLSLSTAVKAVYWGDYGEDSAVLLDRFADFGDQEIEDGIIEFLKENESGMVVRKAGADPQYDDYEAKGATTIIWVKPLKKTNEFSSTYLHYGNEASLECAYGEICLVTTVPRPKDRIKQ